jgi:hypothetical protein
LTFSLRQTFALRHFSEVPFALGDVGSLGVNTDIANNRAQVRVGSDSDIGASQSSGRAEANSYAARRLSLRLRGFKKPHSHASCGGLECREGLFRYLSRKGYFVRCRQLSAIPRGMKTMPCHENCPDFSVAWRLDEVCHHITLTKWLAVNVSYRLYAFRPHANRSRPGRDFFQTRSLDDCRERRTRPGQ